mmetsp:Transcript_54853/g.138602  ORF Transcript_54853/g.138602 Transcript_54853/m.138602 type:complete len:107 (+) Transcript_54853:958-1278(+)
MVLGSKCNGFGPRTGHQQDGGDFLDQQCAVSRLDFLYWQKRRVASSSASLGGSTLFRVPLHGLFQRMLFGERSACKDFLTSNTLGLYSLHRVETKGTTPCARSLMD